MNVRKLVTALMELNFKTLYFNLRYLPFKHAIYLPVFISKHVFLMKCKGKITLEGEIRTRQIRIGHKSVGIFDHKRSRTIWQVEGEVVFRGKATIGHGSKISVGQDGKLIFGENFQITAESSIVASRKKVEFGSNCLLSWDILIMDTDFHKIYNDQNEQINLPNDIYIGNSVWIGCRCIVLKGAVIPNNSIIAANTTVNRTKLEGEHKIFGDQPIRELKSGVSWSH